MKPPKAAPRDSRAGTPRTTETPCALARYRTLDEWQARARQLREQVLASGGLLPFPEKTPLRAKVFGALERAGYTVEKAYLESRPGLLVCGNLWRPADGKGPFPGVLCPHGHWRYGRLENGALGSVVDRCMDLARQGYVVFAYDMIGYVDSKQLPHERVGGCREEMWGISLMGLQLWNSIRALDFLLSLPDVDSERIACTGASGGGTQTFLLTAVDDRVKVSAPVNMISATYQGGCVCENGPNLRLDTNNVELGALMAPRPMILVSCTGDWTKNTPKVEYPWIRGIYALYNATERVATHQVDEDHNYNLESRHTVYRWFARWLQSPEAYERFTKRSFGWERGTDPGDLMVFFSRKLRVPKTERLVGQIVRSSNAVVKDQWPRSNAQLARYRRVFGPAYRSALAAELPARRDVVASEAASVKRHSAVVRNVVLSRKGKGDHVPGELRVPMVNQSGHAVLIVSDRGKAEVGGAKLSPLVSRLLARGCQVMVLDTFGVAHPRLAPNAERELFTTYNRTPAANSVQDILTAVSWLSAWPSVKSVSLVGEGRGGIWCLLARGLAPKVSACVGDLDRFDADRDEAWAAQHFVPLLRRAGDVRTAVALAAPGRLMLHNTGERFSTSWAEHLYARLRSSDSLAVLTAKASVARIADFLLG